jgi:hypothetical protein
MGQRVFQLRGRVAKGISRQAAAETPHRIDMVAAERHQQSKLKLKRADAKLRARLLCTIDGLLARHGINLETVGVPNRISLTAAPVDQLQLVLSRVRRHCR